LPADTASLLLLLREQPYLRQYLYFCSSQYLHFGTSKAMEIGGPGGGAAEAEAASCQHVTPVFVLVY
jgi:hypothetical protein